MEAGVAADLLARPDALGQVLLDELSERTAVALQECGAERLAVIGQDQQFVGPGGLVGDVVAHAPDHPVVLLENAEGITRPRPRMMGHFVVAGPGDVDRGSATEDVEGSEVGCHIPHEHGASPAQEGIGVMQAVQARLNIPRPRLKVLGDLQQGVAEHEHDGAHQKVGIHCQQVDVRGPQFLLFGGAALQLGHGQDRLFGVSV